MEVIEKNENISIGERIREIRENFNMSRERFAEMVGISDVFLGQIERGECSLSLKTLKSIIKFSGCSADYILFGDNSNNSKIEKIDRILKNNPDITVDFIYDLTRSVHSFYKKLNKLK